jgi:hypothetical protein
MAPLNQFVTCFYTQFSFLFEQDRQTFLLESIMYSYNSIICNNAYYWRSIIGMSYRYLGEGMV